MCHSFVEVDLRHVTPGLGINDLITHSSSNSQSVRICIYTNFWSSQYSRGYMEGQTDLAFAMGQGPVLFKAKSQHCS